MLFDIYEKIQEAWNCSTRNKNRYKEVIESIAWDDRFTADGEYYFILKNMIFTTEVLNPFDLCNIRPAFIFPDGSEIAI